MKSFVKQELSKYQIKLKGLDTEMKMVSVEPNIGPITIGEVDPKNPNQIENLGYEDVVLRASKMTGDAMAGKLLFVARSCAACHTGCRGSGAQGAASGGILGKRYRRPELIESIVPSECEACSRI